MSIFSSSPCGRRLARLSAFLMLPAVVWVASARAQSLEGGSVEPAATTPYALFQYSSLTGSGNTINVSRVPVVNSSGVTSY